MKNIVKLALGATLVSAFLCTAWAQQNLGVIIGKVTDPSGAVVAGASVSLTDHETGVRRNATTGGSGNYAFGGLPFGNYDIVVQAKGFRKLVQNGIRVTSERA